MAGVSYRDAGVDIDAGAEAVSRMKAAVRSTFGPRVLSDLGAFGGLFDAGGLTAGGRPVLVASTDGVGTKTKVATALGKYDTIGMDIVHHCINDILVQGAEPLFFLDYVAASKLDPAMIATIVGGCAAACREAGVALLGGETAEMPGVYAPGEFDLVGTIVGVVDRGELIDGAGLEAGDAVIGVPSAGLHTNGFSLARRIFEGWALEATPVGLSVPLGEALLAPHRCYLSEHRSLRAAGIGVRGMAHITGGGLVDNPPRMLREGLAVSLDRGTWSVPPLFELMGRIGQVPDREMARVFNMGIGMLFYVAAADTDDALRALGPDAVRTGEIIARPGAPVVVFEGEA